MATEADQGYSVVRYMDTPGNEVFVVPDFGGIPGVNTLGTPAFVARLAVTSAQLLALHTTPLVIIPALAPAATGAAANGVIVPVLISMHYLYATAAYTLNAGTLRLSYGPVTNANYLCADQSAILTNTANEINPSIAVTLPGVLTEANGLNQAIYLTNPGSANFTAGGGSLVVGVMYHIFNM